MRPPERGGHMKWNPYSKKPAPHIRGEESEGNFTINRGCHARGKLYAYSQAGGIVTDAPTNPQATIENMMAWMFARDDLRRFIHGVELRESDCPHVNDSGFWLYVSLNGHNPQANTPVEAFGNGVRCGYHGTSLHCLNRIIATGLRIGPAENNPRGKSIKAIFSWGHFNAWKVTHYAHYAAIDNSGWVWAPVIYLTLPNSDPHNRKSQLGDQQLSYPDTTRLHVFLLHALPICSMAEGDGAGPWPFSIVAQTAFSPAEELSPLDSWEDIVRASQPH